MMKLTPANVRSMEVARVRRDNARPINALDFFHDGSMLITSSDDDSIRLYNCMEGKLQKLVYSRKFGACHVRFTHHPLSVICASRNAESDHALRYLSLHDNQFLRYFQGHTAPVTALEMSPKEDLFVSAARDLTVRLWDLRQEGALGLLPVPNHTPPAVSFDPEGLIFATAMSDQTSRSVRLYDMRSYAKGPFTTFRLSGPPVVFHHLTFSNDGKTILLPAINSDSIELIDAFDGNQLASFRGHSNASGLALEASFTPDGQFVLSGSDDGRIHVWHAATGREVAVWQGHSSPTLAVRWSPTHMLAASACASSLLCLWIPGSDAGAGA
jgi:COMPASS component SWD2